MEVEDVGEVEEVEDGKVLEEAEVGEVHQLPEEATLLERLSATPPTAADLTAAGAKLRDFTTEAALASAKVVAICFSALVLGVLPGRSKGHFWPPFNKQVFGPEISTYFTDPYTFLHFEVGHYLP